MSCCPAELAIDEGIDAAHSFHPLPDRGLKAEKTKTNIQDERLNQMYGRKGTRRG